MRKGSISPLELAGEEMDIDNSDLTVHISPPEGQSSHATTYHDTARDELLESRDFSPPKIKMIMDALQQSSPPFLPPSLPTWAPSHEVDVEFAKLYTKSVYTFASPQERLPPTPRAPKKCSNRSASPAYSSSQLQRRGAISGPSGHAAKAAKLTHHISSVVRKVPAAAAPLPPIPTTTSSPFMELPGELRNRIYFYSLLRPGNVEITAQNWPSHQPALLRTSKTIRHETLSMFYTENNISANIHDWNPAAKDASHNLLERYGLKTTQFSHYFTGGPNWTNLLAWLKAVFEGEVRGIGDVVGKQRSLERKTVGVMFMMVAKAKGGCMHWDDLRVLLEAQRGLLVIGDSRWSF